MSKTVSARISNKNHEELRERCNKVGCTMNEWINECINYLLTDSSNFDFGEETSYDESKVTIEEIPEKIPEAKIISIDGKPVKKNSEGKYVYI